MLSRLSNPIISGFNPDPSACAIGEDIYIATSSFSWFPGVPIHHSRDLVHWRHIGNALDRPSQLPLERAGLNGGIWAPTLRHHAGRFYLITTNCEHGGNFIVHAERPEGPWSEPVWLDLPGWDPSLDWDDDGTCWFTGTRDGGMIYGCSLDPLSGRPTSPVRDLWDGSGIFGVEAPHLVHHDGWYVLVVAGGFYQRGHLVAAARSRSPWGPYEPCPHNPLLTQRDRLAHPIQSTGHGDLFRTADQRWWICFLGVRNCGGLGGSWHTLGRESFLAPLAWRDGWPVIEAPESELPAPFPLQPWPQRADRDDFSEGALGPAWISLRGTASASLSERAGWLTVRGPGVVARRVEQPWMRASCLVEGRGSMSLFTSETARVDIELHADRVAMRRTFEDWTQEVASATCAGPVEIEILGNPWAFLLRVRSGGCEILKHKMQSRLLSTDLSGGCVGLVVGLSAAADEVIAADWFELQGWRSQQESGLDF